MPTKEEKLESDTKLRMVMAVNVARSVMTLCKGQIEFYGRHGFDVRIFAAEDDTIDSIFEEGGQFFNVGFVRELSPFADLFALIRLIRLLASQKPQVIQFVALKTSLICLNRS
jgi:hypothetical protein